jgi:hypothetical protein
MTVTPLSWKIETQRVDRGLRSASLRQSGPDSASAELLISRKRAGLEDLMNQETKCLAAEKDRQDDANGS